MKVFDGEGQHQSELSTMPTKSVYFVMLTQPAIAILTSTSRVYHSHEYLMALGNVTHSYLEFLKQECKFSKTVFIFVLKV